MWLCGWLAGRSREGQEAKRMRLEKKKGGGELRTPLQASEQVWTAAAGAQSTLSKAASGIGTSSPAEMHKHWAIVNNLGSCLVFFFPSCDTGHRWLAVLLVVQTLHGELSAGYATGEKVESGRLWPGARSREVRWSRRGRWDGALCLKYWCHTEMKLCTMCNLHF